MKIFIKKNFSGSEERPEFLEEKSDKIKEYFHWALLIAPIISTFLAKYVGHIEKPIEIGLVIISILFNFFLLWLWSFYEYRRTKELRLFRTFWLSKLPASKKGGQLLTNTDIAVIEDENNAYYREQLEEKYKKDLLENTAERVPIKDENLKFREVLCESFDLSNLDEEKKSEKENDLKTNVENDISSSKIVIVVRTKALDEKPWVYKAVENWAVKNSDSPCLFIRKKGEDYSHNKIADNFRWIYDNPKLLPWKLLQRAKHRSYAWRMQARFNKAMVTNLFALLIMIFLIGIFIKDELEKDNKNQNEKTSFIFHQQREDIYKTLDLLNKDNELLNRERENLASSPKKEQPLINDNKSKIDQNQERIKASWRAITEATRDEYKTLYTNLNNNEDEELEISYWFRNNENAQAFTTTEKQPEIDHFPFTEKKSTIVCVFNNPNHYAVWQTSKNYISTLFFGENVTYVFDFEGKEFAPQNCITVERKSKPIGAITCVSYNRHNENIDKYTVGICAFSRNKEKNIFKEDFNKFLEDRVREFDKYVYYLLEKDILIPMISDESGKIYPLITSEN